MLVGVLHPQFHHRLPEYKTWSGRVRAQWLWENWPEAEPFRAGMAYDAVIYSAACTAPCARAPGIPLRILDVYNPDWDDMPRFARALGLCHAVTCSSPETAELLSRMTAKPVVCIPDRLDITRYPAAKEHRGRARKAVWFGYSGSQETLLPLLPRAFALGLEVTVVSDTLREELFRGLGALPAFEPYDGPRFEARLPDLGDMALNARLDYGRFRYKSNNRMLTAWALGLPVADEPAKIEVFLDPVARGQEARLRLSELRRDWDIRISVREFRALIASLRTGAR